MNTRLVAFAAGTLFLWSGTASAAVVIQFDYRFDEMGSDFFGVAERRDRLEDAADVFEAWINDDLTAIVPGGGNTWDAEFSNPDTGMATSLTDLTIAADTILVFVGARDLGGSTLGLAGPGGFDSFGTPDFNANLATRGEVGAPNTDFGPWGGVASFDINSTWHFGAGLPGAGENDFLSTAIHELAHVLGFGTSQSWMNQVFDVDPGVCASGRQFQGMYSGDVCVDDDAHWEAGTMSGGQEAAMDPDLLIGTRKLFTPLDFNGLDDVGWVPEPATALLLSAGLLGLGYRVSRRSTSRSRSA